MSADRLAARKSQDQHIASVILSRPPEMVILSRPPDPANLGDNNSADCSVPAIQKHPQRRAKCCKSVLLDSLPRTEAAAVLLGVCELAKKGANPHHIRTFGYILNILSSSVSNYRSCDLD